jgi:SAM-dependent methyltransferase
MWRRSGLIGIVLALSVSELVQSFSLSPKGDEEGDPVGDPNSFSRRDLLYWPVGIGGAVVYGKLVGEAVSKLSRGELAYPEAHERRVEEMISKALIAGIPSDPKASPMRVLEVGIGNECRLLQRGLYNSALAELSSRGLSKLELVGVDISVPKGGVQEAATARFQKAASRNGIDASLDILQNSITSPLTFPDGWFDAVVCSLTLCSVDDQDAAINEIKRLVRPSGGTFGYVEHVAVNSDEPYRLLSLQQEAFDPLQQIVADNCHLHRFTDSNVGRIFGIDDDSMSKHPSLIFKERYIVDGMWPVSCQACGVVQKLV